MPTSERALRQAGDKVRRLQEQTTAAIVARDALVIAARADGLSVAEVAEAAGLTPANVKYVCFQARKAR